jgi:YidC/Oxa1 family membrane protein insertase
VVASAQKATIFGVHLYSKLLFAHPSPSLHVAIVIALTVVVSATTTFMTVRQTSKRGLMQTNVDPDNPMAGMQKNMMYIVPFFSLTGLYWQYGLVLYWVTTNVWTLGQQFFMFRNWEVEPAGAAGATAAATPPAGSAKAAARTGSASARTGSASARTGSASARTGSASARTGSASTRTGSASTRPASSTTQVKRDGSAGSRPAGGSNGSSAARAGSASRAAAATSPGAATTAPAPAPATGQNGGEKRSLLRLGRPKQEPAPEPEVPATKVVRQQPVRQAKSKRSGKR